MNMNLEKAIIFISVLCDVQALVEPPLGVERYIYCESCLATVKEMEAILTNVPDQSRKAVVEKLVDEVTCETVFFENGPSTDKMIAACKQLLEMYSEDFSEAFLSKESKHLDILLCYERTFACVGVHRLKNQNNTGDIMGNIEALLHKNKVNVRTAMPVRMNASKASKDEL